MRFLEANCDSPELLERPEELRLYWVDFLAGEIRTIMDASEADTG